MIEKIHNFLNYQSLNMTSRNIHIYKVALLDDFYVVDKVMLNIHLRGGFRGSPGSPPSPFHPKFTIYGNNIIVCKIQDLIPKIPYFFCYFGGGSPFLEHPLPFEISGSATDPTI
jgi:hypothetical protein